MNSEENNEKQIDKLSRMEQIYSDAEKHKSVMDKIKDEDDDICAPARKIFKWALFLTWGVCLVTLVSGGDFSVAASAILFASGVYAALCVTKFIHEHKKWDTLVSVIVAVVTIALGIILLTGGRQ